MKLYKLQAILYIAEVALIASTEANFQHNSTEEVNKYAQISVPTLSNNLKFYV